MKTLQVEGGSIEYEVRGEGAALLLIHGAIVADSWEAMLGHAGLIDNHRVITYRRRGFGGSSAAPEGRSLSDEGADAIALLDHLGVDRAHAAGHSYAGALVLQLALDAPERLASLALLEPAMFTVPAAAGFGEALAPVGEMFQAGNHEQALLAFMEGVGGPNLMERLAPNLPEGADAMALTDLPTLFANDLPVVSGWAVNEHAARAISLPALTVLGEKSEVLFHEGIAAIEALLPNTERLDVPGVGHFLQMEKPKEVAEGLAAFLASRSAIV